MKRIITLAVVLALGLIAVPGATQAGTYRGGGLTLSTHNLTVWGSNCADAHYEFDTNFPDTQFWTVNVDVYGPRGAWVGGNVFADYDFDSNGTAYLCGGYNTPGRYRVTAEYETRDIDQNVLETRTVTGYFTFTRRTKQPSTLTMVKTRKGAHSWKIVGRLTKAGKPWAGHRVQIQAYSRAWGGWAVIKAKPTNRNGRVVFTSTPKRGAGKYPARLHSVGGSYVKDASSRNFRLRPR